jgi:hypothetical protein
VTIEFPQNLQRTILITLHERQQSVFYPIPYLGATSFAVNPMPGYATTYEVTKKVRVTQDRDEMRCDPNNEQKLLSCLQEYFDRNLECYLPWRPNVAGKK